MQTFRHVFRGLSFLIVAAACAFSIAADTATIRGAATFSGTPPEMPKIRTSADPTCLETRGGTPPTRQDVIVNRNSTLKNVIVWVRSGLPEGVKYPMPAEAAVLDQRGCMYEPHVLVLRAGQDLKILNSDPTVHNINAQPKLNKKFNESMISNKVPPRIQRFDKPEVPVQIKCDVHPWMLSWAGVFDHPFFALTGEDGTFEIKNLPPGEYTVAAWHEEYGLQEQKITVGAGETKELTFPYKAAGGAPVAK